MKTLAAPKVGVLGEQECVFLKKPPPHDTQHHADVKRLNVSIGDI